MIDGSVRVYSGRARVNEAKGQTPISAFFKLDVWRKIAVRGLSLFQGVLRGLLEEHPLFCCFRLSTKLHFMSTKTDIFDLVSFSSS